MAIIALIPRPERRRMHKAIQSTSDKGFARRLIALLALHEGKSIIEVHDLTGAARSSIGRWINWFTKCGMDGLKSLHVGRPPQLPMNEILSMLVVLIQLSAQDLGYQRSRWCTELLTLELNKLFSSSVAASTVRRWLPKAGIVWRRAAPTLCIRDPHRAEKMEKINQALVSCSAKHPVFYEDEVDVVLNPKIGSDWVMKGQQKRVPTPGKNEKHYLAGSLHSTTGKVLYVSRYNKNSELFITMLEKLKRHYRGAKL